MSISELEVEESWSAIEILTSSVKCYVLNETFKMKYLDYLALRSRVLFESIEDRKAELKLIKKRLLDLLGEQSKKHYPSLILARNDYQDLFSLIYSMIEQISDNRDMIVSEMEKLNEIRDIQEICQMNGIVEIRHLVFEGVFAGKDILRN